MIILFLLIMAYILYKVFSAVGIRKNAPVKPHPAMEYLNTLSDDRKTWIMNNYAVNTGPPEPDLEEFRRRLHKC